MRTSHARRIRAGVEGGIIWHELDMLDLGVWKASVYLLIRDDKLAVKAWERTINRLERRRYAQLVQEEAEAAEELRSMEY